MALGPLGWSPSAFWNATPHELSAAHDGYAKANGQGPPDFMTPERLAELVEEYPD